MKTFPLGAVKLTGGYLFEKQELNRKTTIHAVYDQFDQTGRIGASGTVMLPNGWRVRPTF